MKLDQHRGGIRGSNGASVHGIGGFFTFSFLSASLFFAFLRLSWLFSFFFVFFSLFFIVFFFSLFFIFSLFFLAFPGTRARNCNSLKMGSFTPTPSAPPPIRTSREEQFQLSSSHFYCPKTTIRKSPPNCHSIASQNAFSMKGVLLRGSILISF